MNKVGMKQIVENGQRLQNYMKSVDDDLKTLQTCFNDNMIKLVEAIERLEVKLCQMEKLLNKLSKEIQQ